MKKRYIFVLLPFVVIFIGTIILCFIGSAKKVNNRLSLKETIMEKQNESQNTKDNNCLSNHQLILKEEFTNDYLITVTEDEMNTYMDLEYYGFMNTIPQGRYFAGIRVNLCKNKAISMNSNEFLSIITDGNRHCFVISELKDMKLDPIGMICTDAIYEMSSIMSISLGTNLETVSSAFSKLIVSPTLMGSGYDQRFTYSILSYDGLFNIFYDNSFRVSGLSLVHNNYVNKVLSMLDKTRD